MFSSAVARKSIVDEVRSVVKPLISGSDSDSTVPPEPEFLSEWSPRDKPWDAHKTEADLVSGIFRSDINPRFQRYSGRVNDCAEVLSYAWGQSRNDPGEFAIKLKTAHFCHVRHCPICQWRRSLMYLARFLEALPRITADNPSARWVFLTLTCKNVPVEELRSGLAAMNKAWDRLAKKKAFGVVRGWVRTTEVSRGTDGLAHPHFHVLMMVNSNYFTKNYITQAQWAQMWGNALRADYQPIIHIQAVKPKAGTEEIAGAVRETLKYAVKPGDMTNNPEWFLELTRQLHKLRFIATGGVLKNIMRESEETQADLLLAGEGEVELESEVKPVVFDYSRQVQRYRKRSDRL